MAEILQLRKRANKDGQDRVTRYDPVTGERKLVNPATAGMAHEPYPFSHLEAIYLPKETKIPTTTVLKGKAEGWLSTDDGKVVHRPSRPDIRVEGGSAAPQQTDFLPPHDLENPPPHTFLHVNTITLHTSNYGDVVYKVTHQPDKYADSSLYDYSQKKEAKANDYDDKTKVSREIYEAGDTRVDHYYGVVLESVEYEPSDAQKAVTTADAEKAAKAMTGKGK